jgi:DNA-binding LytR/AlgR family response regulator
MSPQLKVAIVQNNSTNNDILRHCLSVVNPEIKVCGAAENIEQAIGLIEKHKPDIIFWDTCLSFKIADIIYQKGLSQSELVFLSPTKNCEYALKAIEFGCLDFIVQPITENAVRRATEKAKERYMQKLLFEYIKQQPRQEASKIIVPTRQNSKETIETDKISYFEAQKQSTIMHYSDGSYSTISRNLGYFKKILTGNTNFCQIHHALLVNTKHIKSFDSKSQEVIMMNGEVLEASRRYSMNFKAFWNEFSKHHYFT